VGFAMPIPQCYRWSPWLLGELTFWTAALAATTGVGNEAAPGAGTQETCICATQSVQPATAACRQQMSATVLNSFQETPADAEAL
jgi:hypothetical protein